MLESKLYYMEKKLEKLSSSEEENDYRRFFDLDGTLTNPMTGITKSVQYALKSFGIDVKDNRELTFLSVLL